MLSYISAQINSIALKQLSNHLLDNILCYFSLQYMTIHNLSLHANQDKHFEKSLNQ